MRVEQLALEDRLGKLLAKHEPVTKRMFGGLCFMVRGHMLVGTFRNGMMARVAKQSHAEALKRPGASAMEMKGRVMEGFILITAESVRSDAVMQNWIDLALAYNKTLPAKELKGPAKKPPRN